MSNLMPVIFFGHGNPLNALWQNTYTEGWVSIGKSIPRPRAILALSAHWYIPGCAVTADIVPETIHDFGGFPPELYEIQYPAPGSPELARRIMDLLAPVSVEFSEDRGLDHGTWVVLRHVFPDADVPVVQLSINSRQPLGFHYAMGKKLAPLRKEGVLIIGSGNVVHNLHAYAWGDREVGPFDWAVRFEKVVKEALLTGNDEAIVEYKKLGPDARLSVPTPEHYLPLLYVVGLREQEEEIAFPVEGVDGGSVSMLTVRIG